MAEIKSSLEIALERAAALGGGDRSEMDRAEGRKQGEALARKALAGDLEPEEAGRRVLALEGEAGQAARQAAATTWLDALPEKMVPALPGLRVLAEAADALGPLEGVMAALEELRQGTTSLDEALAIEVSEQLGTAGIQGIALRPNPAAHPDYQARGDQALGQARSRLEAAKADLAQALEG